MGAHRHNPNVRHSVMPDITERFDNKHALLVRRHELIEQGKQHIHHFTDYELATGAEGARGAAKTVWFLVYQEPFTVQAVHPQTEVTLGHNEEHQDHAEEAVRQENEITNEPDPPVTVEQVVLPDVSMASVPAVEYETT